MLFKYKKNLKKSSTTTDRNGVFHRQELKMEQERKLPIPKTNLIAHLEN
jgi:hypothetical protein